ncbi:putative CheA signal transduction histidine kinase [Cyanobacterium stanieri PCC 7202]|uniref:histidine kinase n=1 Tax=Cyanobacterium stanieri (strain ATCC 29140 / PCC 7202) TaxID=292563 RepID=K9YQ62_CYASC|nr:putative CheA signal transduction histidine kinase [Cyanobacterium stanieri PCC 7202]
MSSSSQAQELYKQSLLRLGAMLKLLKQGDSPEHRRSIQKHCEALSLEGRKQNLFGWVAIMETSQGAIAKPHHEYISTTKLIIKEIKTAAEYLLKGDLNAISVSDQLLELAPSARTRFMDVETVYAGADMDTSSEEITPIPENESKAPELDSPPSQKNTIEKDLWRETLFTNTEKFAEQVSTGDEDLTSFITDDEEDIFTDTDDEETVNNSFHQNTHISDEHPTRGNDLFDNIFTSTNEQDTGDFEQLFDEMEDATNDGNSMDEEWDFLDEETSSEPLSNGIEDLFDEPGAIDFGTDNLTVHHELQDPHGTVIIENPQDEIADLVSQIEHQEEPSSQDLVFSDKLIIYDQFEDLDYTIVQENHLLSETELFSLDLWETTPSTSHYYEQFEELEKVINSRHQSEIEVNWQQLEKIVGEKINLSQSSSSVSEENNLEKELSDLDRLLAEAEKPSHKKPWTKPQAPTVQTQKQPTFEQSMRVPVKQLDSLNNLIGEMVIRRNRLQEDQEKLRQFLDNLLSHAQDLSEVGDRTQDMYEKSLLEGSLINSRKRNQSTVREQLERGNISQNTSKNRDQTNNSNAFFPEIELDDLELDRFSEFHLLAQEMIELVVRIRESTSDIQFLVDETDQLGKNIRDITDQLQEQINKSRMVPFAQNADRLPLPIRKIAQGYDKQVQLKVEGREVLIDKMILEHLWDPLLQIVKNSVTHGIEQPEERKANGKDPMGTITVRAFLQGPQTVISISDDGAGINAHKVKEKAIQKNLITPEEANTLKNQEIYDFLFHAGFTTKEKADSHAGRGVGLDIVRNKLNEIRGSVTIDSIPGRGTTFTMRLPLTLTIGKALCCLNDNVRIAFPIDGIEDTKILSRQNIEKDEDGKSYITWNKNKIPLRPLNQLLQYNRQMSRSFMYGSGTNDENTVSVIILRGGNNILAVEVDQILPEEEIVIKQISGPLPKPKGISGATVRSDGTIMPVGDVIELIQIAEGSLSNQIKSQMFPSVPIQRNTMFESQVNVAPLVLIVDDSITVREMLSMTFSKEGYRVEQARDGQEAWQKLRSGLPCNLIFCDIEMPRMNGLELLQHLQEESEFAHIPMAILSSRGSQRHQKIAAELGACAYLIKPCVDKELIDSAQRMMNGEVLLEGSTRVSTAKITDIQADEHKSTFGGAKRRTNSAPMVLIIDDSVVVREMLSLSFKKAGYEVEVARDGQDAWEKLAEGLPCDIVLCDIEMPRMNGLELLARMQQDDVLCQLPVAMVTSRGAEKHRSIAADLGARAYFTKPYIEDELLDVAKRMINGEIFLTSSSAKS